MKLILMQRTIDFLVQIAPQYLDRFNGIEPQPFEIATEQKDVTIKYFVL